MEIFQSYNLNDLKRNGLFVCTSLSRPPKYPYVNKQDKLHVFYYDLGFIVPVICVFLVLYVCVCELSVK